MNKHYLEEDLFLPVKNFFVEMGYDVRSEVNDCDITAVKDDQLVIIELKKNLTVELLVQAVKRQKLTDIVYIAIPKPHRSMFTRKRTDIRHLIKRLELGLIFVSFKNDKASMQIEIQPSVFDRSKSLSLNKKKRIKLEKEIKGRTFDLNIGGSTGKKLMTSYKENALYMACCIELFGPLAPAELKKYGAEIKNISSVLNKNYYGRFDKISRGLYNISEKAKNDIMFYKDLTDILKKNINKVAGLKDGF